MLTDVEMQTASLDPQVLGSGPSESPSYKGALGPEDVSIQERMTDGADVATVLMDADVSWIRFGQRRPLLICAVCCGTVLFGTFVSLLGYLAGAKDPTSEETSTTSPSDRGRWASLPGPGGPALNKVLFGSCADQRRPQAFWDVAAMQRPDLLLLMGDTVYGDCHDASCSRLNDAYANLSLLPSFQGFQSSVPVLATWDDHDFGVSDGGGDFLWKDRAKDLFLDFFSIGSTDVRRVSGRGVHASYILGPPGREVQIILLDTRWYRSPLLRTSVSEPGRERYIPDSSMDKTILGDDQWQWLASELRRPAALRFLVSSIQAISEAHGFEKWGNLPQERERLLETLRAATPPPFIFSGDRHVGGFYQESSSEPWLWEVTSSSLTHTSIGFPSEMERNDSSRLGGLVNLNHLGAASIDWEQRLLSIELIQVEDGSAGHHPRKTGLPIGTAIQHLPF